MIRSIIKHSATFLVVVVAGIGGYFGFIHWANPAPIAITTNDGRPYATAEQPPIAPWTRTLDNSGYDISFPQCSQWLPTTQVGFAIVGLNDGKPFTSNPCFGSQWKWALTHDGSGIYINVADLGTGSATKYGKRIGKDTLQRLAKAGVSTDTPVWLDIETSNTWSTPNRSMQVINEAMSVLTQAGHPVGIYSAPTHWFEISLNAVVGVPVWLPIGTFNSVADGVASAKIACTQVAFGDRVPAMVQFVAKKSGSTHDHNLLCGAPDGLLTQN